MSAQPQTHAPNLGMKPTTFENPMGIDGCATRPARSPFTARAASTSW